MSEWNWREEWEERTTAGKNVDHVVKIAGSFAASVDQGMWIRTFTPRGEHIVSSADRLTCGNLIRKPKPKVARPFRLDEIDPSWWFAEKKHPWSRCQISLFDCSRDTVVAHGWSRSMDELRDDYLYSTTPTGELKPCEVIE